MAAATATHNYRDLIGDMYARWTLDAVVEIAHAVSLDYVSRPDFYRGPVPDNIVDLLSSWGTRRWALSDRQLSVIIAASHPLPAHCRSAFLADVARELANLPEVGDGALHRVIMSRQRVYFDPPTLDDAHGYSKYRR